MEVLSKEEKRALLKKWKADQNKKYVLSKTRVRKLFGFLEKKLEEEPCDHTLRFTTEWIQNNCKPEQKEAILQELRDMGGYCDCEVLANCYEKYDLC